MAEQEPAADALAAYLQPFREAWARLAVQVVHDFEGHPREAYRLLLTLDRRLKSMHNEQMSGMKAEEVYLDNEQQPGRTLAQLGQDFNRSTAQMHSDLKRARAKRRRPGEE